MMGHYTTRAGNTAYPGSIIKPSGTQSVRPTCATNPMMAHLLRRVVVAGAPVTVSAGSADRDPYVPTDSTWLYSLVTAFSTTSQGDTW